MEILVQKSLKMELRLKRYRVLKLKPRASLEFEQNTGASV
jgi:hypothetical protein